MKYLFKLGHQPEISKAEIFSLIDQQDKWCGVADRQGDKLILSSEEIEPSQMMEKLGGTVYIAEKINSEGSNIKEQITNYLEDNSQGGKIEFTISGKDSTDLLLPVKRELQDRNQSARFVKLENTASIKYNNLVDSGTHLNIFDEELYATKAIQPFEQLKAHDYERPASDPESGMLPPKLARIMLNLAQVEQNDNLLDPFCGSGTILLEAASTGRKKLLGSDKEEQAIKASEQNLDWIKEKESLNINYRLINQPVEQISEKIDPKTIDKIVTEPYLGEPRTGGEDKSFLKKQAHQLRRLYIDAFYEFAEILKEGREVVFIIPKFKYNSSWIEVNCIEEIKNAGFEITPFEDKQSLFYARQDQLVGREIYKFKKL